MNPGKTKSIREMLNQHNLVGFDHLPVDSAVDATAGHADTPVKSSVAKSGKSAAGKQAFIID